MLILEYFFLIGYNFPYTYSRLIIELFEMSMSKIYNNIVHLLKLDIDIFYCFRDIQFMNLST